MNTLGLFDFVLWLLVVQLLAFAALPYIAWMSPNAPDRGYGLSKVLGVFAFSALCWTASLCGLTTENNLLVRGIFLAVLCVGWRGYYSRWLTYEDARRLVKTYGRSVEGLFLGLTLFFGIIRFVNPQIFWGEKPMDSTFLNFFIRNQTLPPQDPWAAGSLMSYYYLGIYIVAAVLKATGISGAVGFNLAMATLGGWIGSALFSLMLLLTRGRKFATVSAALLVLASDPEVLLLSILNIINHKPFNFDTTFWPSTRVFTSPSFMEYTSWSLLFADLHAHVVAIPFTVVALALATIVFLDGSTRYTAKGVALRFVLGTIVGSLFGINTWDFISFGGVAGVLVVLSRVPLFWKPPTNQDGSKNYGEVILVTAFSRLVALVWDGMLVGASAGLVVWLYQKGVSFRPGGGWGWVSSPEFNSFLKLFRVLGYWMVGMLLSVSMLAMVRIRNQQPVTVPQLLVGGALLALAFVPGLLSVARDNYMHPWATFAYCGVLVSSAYILLWSQDEKPEVKVLGIFMSSAGALIVLLEVFFLLDRMNTLFKGYMAVWMLSGVSTMAGLYHGYQVLARQGAIRPQKIARRVGYTFAFLLLLGTSVNVHAIINLRRVPSGYFTLDGIKYLEGTNPDDAALISWLNEHVIGTPTVLEAHGDGYREYTRISMHTGLPTLLGWEHHTRQRGLSHESLLDRRKAIQAIYTHEDIELTKQLLLENRIDFIVVGSVERATYRRLDSDKFDSHPELFTKVASFGKSALYVTYFSKYNQVYRSKVNS